MPPTLTFHTLPHLAYVLADAVKAQGRLEICHSYDVFVIIHILLLLNLVNKASTLMCCYQVLVVHANWLVSKVKTREDKLKRSGAQMLNLEDDQ